MHSIYINIKNVIPNYKLEPLILPFSENIKVLKQNILNQLLKAK